MSRKQHRSESGKFSKPEHRVACFVGRVDAVTPGEHFSTIQARLEEFLEGYEAKELQIPILQFHEFQGSTYLLMIVNGLPRLI